MERLTTDNPNGNVQSARNLFYIKNKETWVRGGSPCPDFTDVSLYDFMRRIIKIYHLNIEFGTNCEMDKALFERLYEGTETKEGIAATLYASAWAFSELREKLKAYEDTGLEPEEVKSALRELERYRELGTVEELNEAAYNASL